MAKDKIDLIELEGELWREYLRRQLREMLINDGGKLRYQQLDGLVGPFQAGWQLAIEEVALAIGIDYEALEAEAEA